MVTLNKPAAGDTNWATPINSNWTALEGALDQAVCQGRLTLSSGNAIFNPQPNTPSATDTAADTVDFPSPHGWTTGTMVTVSATAGGLTAGTIYYINAVDSDTVSFYDTLANAEAGTSTGKKDLTAAITALITPMGVSRSTVYFSPFRGNRISIHDGSTWQFYSFSEITLSLSALIANVTYDVFAFSSAGTVTLETLAWKKVTASNSPTSGSNKVINVSDTTGLTIGSLVTVKDGTSNESARVNAIVVNTSFTVDTLVNGYTTPDIYYNSRATNIVLQDGLYVKSGDSTRRYLGTLRILSTTGQCEDSNLRRFLWNCYNRISRKMVVTDPTSSWGNGSAAWTSARSSTANRVQLVMGVNEDPVDGAANSVVQSTSGNFQLTGAGVGLDSTTADSSDINGGGCANNTTGLSDGDGYSGHFSLYIGIGYHFLQWLEYGGSTFGLYGTTGPVRSGLKATVLG